MNTGLIILAAGNSVRFCGKKLLYRIGDRKMYEYALDTAQRTGLDAAVVTQYQEIAEAAQSRGFAAVMNRFPERGISYSIRLGTEHFRNKDALIFAVCDQPYLKPETILRLADGFERSPLTIARLTDGTRPGNPVIFDRRYINELLSLSGDTGGKAVIKAHPDEVLYILADSSELTDIDTSRDIKS